MEDSDQNQSDIPKFKSIDSLESLKDKLTEFDKENLSEEITQLINLLKEITSMETIEQYFENDKKTMEYFVSKFCQKIISSILESNNLFSEEIELKALELLYHFFNLFLKFHKNENYLKLFEKLRLIISPEKNLFLFPKPTTENNLLKYKKYFSYFQYNQENCLSFINTKLYSPYYQKGDYFFQ